MSRLPAVDPDAVPEVASVFREIAGARGSVSNVLKSLAHSPDGLRRLAHLGAWARYDTSLDARIRELAICTVGRDLPYIWWHHESLALQADIPQAAIDGIKRGLVPPELPEEEQAVVRYVLELDCPTSVCVETFAALQKHWGAREITDMSIVAAYYLAIGTLCKAWKVEFDSDGMKDDALNWQRAKDERRR